MFVNKHGIVCSRTRWGVSREQIKLAPLVVILLADQFLVYAVLCIIATLRVNAELLDLLLL